MILQKIFAGKCFHSKMKLLYGRKPVKEIAIAQGNAAMACIYEKVSQFVYPGKQNFSIGPLTSVYVFVYCIKLNEYS